MDSGGQRHLGKCPEESGQDGVRSKVSGRKEQAEGAGHHHLGGKETPSRHAVGLQSPHRQRGRGQMPVVHYGLQAGQNNKAKAHKLNVKVNHGRLKIIIIIKHLFVFKLKQAYTIV